MIVYSKFKKGLLSVLLQNSLQNALVSVRKAMVELLHFSFKKIKQNGLLTNIESLMLFSCS